jgi:hypothetical protein
MNQGTKLVLLMKKNRSKKSCASVTFKLEAQPFFHFKGTPSQEEHKTIFQRPKDKRALSG